MAITLIDIVFEIFSKSSQKEFHVDEVSRELMRLYPEQYVEFEEAKNKISATLSSNVKSKNPRFRRVKGKKKGTYKRGCYALKRTRKKSINVQEIRSELPKQQTGRGGEFAVISELLFIGHDLPHIVVPVPELVTGLVSMV